MRKVATYGVFDMFHQGHVNLLRRARELGDYLVVGVTTNHFDEIRGKLNTTDSFAARKAAVEASGFADEVIAESYPGQKKDDIRNRGIDVVVFGSDWTGHFDYLQGLCEVVYLPRTEGISSTELRNARHAEVRIGIIGTGRIARRFVGESASVGAQRLVGVYNPNKDHADTFAREMGIGSLPRETSDAQGDAKTKGLLLATDSLPELFDAVDAVYIASPHQYHYEQAKAALSAGKHVLCEKPLALAYDQAAELFELASAKGLVLLEAIKTAYCPGFDEMVSVVRSGIVGEVHDVDASFTKLMAPGVRERDDMHFGGSFLELGSYNLLPAVRLLGAERVRNMDARFYTQFDENGVDVFTRAFLSDSGASAVAKTGLGVKAEGQLVVGCAEGYILVPAPWWLTSRFEVHHEDPNDIQVYEVPFLGSGLRYEISNFVHLIRGDEDRFAKLSPEESMAMADIMERYLAERSAM